MARNWQRSSVSIAQVGSTMLAKGAAIGLGIVPRLSSRGRVIPTCIASVDRSFASSGFASGVAPARDRRNRTKLSVVRLTANKAPPSQMPTSHANPCHDNGRGMMNDGPATAAGCRSVPCDGLDAARNSREAGCETALPAVTRCMGSVLVATALDDSAASGQRSFKSNGREGNCAETTCNVALSTQPNSAVRHSNSRQAQRRDKKARSIAHAASSNTLPCTAIVSNQATMMVMASVSMSCSFRQALAHALKVARRDFRFADKMRNQLARVAAKQRTHQIRDHGAAYLGFADQRAVNQLATLAPRFHDAAFFQARKQRGYRCVLQAALLRKHASHVGHAGFAL